MSRSVLSLLLTAVSLIAPALLADEIPQGIALPENERMLVLVSGKVITGQMTPRPDGYDVLLPAGRLFVASDQIRFEADDLEDAYLKMRASLPELTPTHHVELSRWCVTNKLPHRARRELLDALHLDPNRDDARRLLLSLSKSSTQPPTTREPQGAGLTEFPSTKKIKQSEIETRSLGGFSRDVALGFVQNVQPLMINKCSNTACHGNKTSDFRLTSTRNRSTPMIAEQNLAAVLKQIDLTNPEASPLLKAGLGPHGGMNAPLFRGRVGNAQHQKLRDWVIAAAHEANPELQNATPPSETSPAVVSSDVTSPDRLTANRTDLEESETSADAHGRMISKSETDQQILAEVDFQNRRDEFDPQVFNQKYRIPAANPEVQPDLSAVP